jgi:hypothetical protein
MVVRGLALDWDLHQRRRRRRRHHPCRLSLPLHFRRSRQAHGYLSRRRAGGDVSLVRSEIEGNDVREYDVGRCYERRWNCTGKAWPDGQISPLEVKPVR